MELSSLSRATVPGYNMSALTHFNHHQLGQNWAKFGPKLGKGQGLVVATLLKYQEKPKRARRDENVEGDIFVDRTCIDCDTCRWMAPTVFKRVEGQSAVYHQPESQEERFMAFQALLACPTASIRTEKPPKEIKSVHASFPIPIDPQNMEGVYHCGYHAELSFAATSYFIVRPGGNILVDSPRFTESLAKKFEAMGGVHYMFLTHKDDISDHQRWQARFNCERVLHELEVEPGTECVEIKLQGEGPWSLGPDTELIFTPGHTEGHVVLLLKRGGGALFTGDHLGGTQSDVERPDIRLDKVHNWYSVNLQIESIKKLLPLEFVWLLPGHGRRRYFRSAQEKNEELQTCLQVASN